MSHARIEEVSDSDPSEGDISDVDSEFDERDILKELGPKPSQVPAPKPSFSLINPSNIPSTSVTGSDGTQFQNAVDESKYKEFQCIYPVYFDINRSRNEGRRVGKELAVENPMAREIVAACGRLRLETLFEPTKTHPKDWANPGRIKIKLKGGSNSSIKNKHHLYILISNHLKANPTTVESAIKGRLPGMPLPDSSNPYPEPAVPKGWKIGNLLPYHSAALSGGGVSDNFFKDMMAEMQAGGGQLPAGADMSALQGMMGMGGAGAGAGPSGGNGAPKKQKKKIIRV